MGRNGEKRDMPLSVKFTERECRMIKQAVRMQYDQISNYIRRAVMPVAERDLAGAAEGTEARNGD